MTGNRSSGETGAPCSIQRGPRPPSTALPVSQALSTWVNLIKDKAAPAASFASNGSYDGGNAFESNAVAMVTDGIWVDFATVPKGFSYGVAPFPSGSAGPSTNIGLAVSALFKTTTTQDAGRSGLHQVPVYSRRRSLDRVARLRRA